MTITERTPGNGLHIGNSFFSMKSSNNSCENDPCSISHAIKPLMVYAGRTDHLCCAPIACIHEVRLQQVPSHICSGMCARFLQIHRRIRVVRLCSLPIYASTDPSTLGYVVSVVFGSRN